MQKGLLQSHSQVGITELSEKKGLGTCESWHLPILGCINECGNTLRENILFDWIVDRSYNK